MLTFLFLLASIWTLFWLVIFMRDWDNHDPLVDGKEICTTCGKALKFGSSSDSQAKITKPVAADNTTDNAANFGDTNPAAAKTPVVDTPVVDADVDTNDQATLTPLFEKPVEEADDLKVIKGIGVVMEKTLNDLGITTFKQLAGFQQAEVKMVSDVLSESNAGFGDRIERDEWVDQAKGLVKNKAS